MAFMYDGAYGPNLQTVKAHGGIAVSHYLTGRYAGTSADPLKTRAAGLGAVLNWEMGPGDLVGASFIEGQAIARKAIAAAKAYGAPGDGHTAIYYSVDVDVLAGSYAATDNAFRGIRSVMDPAHFRTGVYGEIGLIEHLVTSHILVGKHWLSMSAGFSPPGVYAQGCSSPLVCLVQMHDKAGNWIDTDIPNTDRNTITDPYALGAWWPTTLSHYIEKPAPVAPTDWLDTVDEATLRSIIRDEVTKVVKDGGVNVNGLLTIDHTRTASIEILLEGINGGGYTPLKDRK